MLLLIEFARTMMDDNECVVLYFEPVRSLGGSLGGQP